jgi:hypothetical protein
MTETELARYIVETYPDAEVVTKAPYTFFFTDPQQRVAYATIAGGDEEGDKLSNLDREGVYRLNIGVAPETFKAVPATEDYAALGRLMPHPVYGAWHWVCVLNPELEPVKPLLAEAYALSRRRYNGA